MKMLKLLTAAAAAAVIFTAAVSADTINTIEQIEQTALLNNLDYKTAVLEAVKAENALDGILKLESSSLSLSGSYPDYKWQAAANLPVFEQLSLSASVDQNFKGTFGFALTPLAHSGSTAQTKLTYSSKLAAAEKKADEVADAAVESYLSWITASADYEVKQNTVNVKKTLYEDEKIRFEKGESDLDIVRDYFSAWSESRTAANAALNKLQTAETGLYTNLNIDPANFNIDPPVEADLSSLIAELESKIDSDSLGISDSIAVLNAENAVTNLELQRENTWLFEPQLNIGGTLEISTAEPQPVLSATASLSFSLDDWNSEEISELEAELEICRQQATQTINSEMISLQQSLTAAETAAINHEVAGIELEQAEELLDEAAFLYGLGEYSEAELEEVSLQLKQSENNYFAAAAEYYISLRVLSGFSN